MPSTTRRRFLKTAALGTMAAVSTRAPAQESPRPADSPAEALAALVRARFGKHLNEAQMKSVQQRLTRMLATSDQMKRTRLDNGDEPAFVFPPME